MTQRPRPRFTGVDTYIDPVGRFSFRYPIDWHKFELEENRDGVMYSPEATDPQTYFAVWATLLDPPVVAEDQEDLRIGIQEGLAGLPEIKIESESEAVFGNLLKFERIFTFKDGEATRKRKLWLLYVDKWQIVVTYQGATPEEYQHWLSMGNYAFHFFTIPPELWFATDRDLSGVKTPVK